MSSADQQIAALFQALDNKPQSAAAWLRSLDLTEQLIREEPLNVLYRRETAITNRSLALLLLRMGRLPEARQRSERSAELFAQLAKEDPVNTEAKEALADSLWSQGYVLHKGNEFAKARGYYEASIATYKEEIAKNPKTLPAGFRTAYQLMAEVGLKVKDVPLTLRSARQELDIDDRLLAANSRNANALHNRGVAYTQIGQAHEITGEWQEARTWHQRALSQWVDLKKQSMLMPGYASRVDDAIRNVTKCDRELGLGKRK